MSMNVRRLARYTVLSAFVLFIMMALVIPATAGAMTQDVTTAKSNETSTGNILGGVPTRITWEAVVEPGESVSSVTVRLPEGSAFTDDTTVRVTVLDGLDRLEVENSVTIDRDKAQVVIDFSEPLIAGLRLRVEMYKTCLPDVNGDVTLSGSFVLADGSVQEMGESPSIPVSYVSIEQKISNWLDEQPWVQAWNSVTFLRLFFEPQLIVKSIPTVAVGWLISIMLVLLGFPLAIPLGLVAAFMKISRSRILKALASIYTGIIRGTPLFLQIYIAFFGLPLMGLSIKLELMGQDVGQYILAVLVMAFNSGAYLCEIFRAGIQSIPKGQFEASRSLGMTGSQTMFSVIIPQTVRRVIPTMTSEFILLYKDTSLLAAVGVLELMLYAKSVVSLTGNMTPYIVAACFYLIVTLPLIHLVGKLENRLALADSGGGAPSKGGKRGRKGADKSLEITPDAFEAPADENHVTLSEDAAFEARAARQQIRADEARAEALMNSAAMAADDASFTNSAHADDHRR